MRLNPRIVIPVVLCLSVVAAGCGSGGGGREAARAATRAETAGVEVRVVRDGEEVSCLCAAVADDEKARNTGLSGSGDPSPFDAMVFRWGELTTPVFWMKDTPGPLDAVFVDADGVIGSIQEMDACEAEDCRLYASESAALFALELRDAEAAGLRLGDLLILGEECTR